MSTSAEIYLLILLLLDIQKQTSIFYIFNFRLILSIIKFGTNLNAIFKGKSILNYTSGSIERDSIVDFLNGMLYIFILSENF